MPDGEGGHAAPAAASIGEQPLVPGGSGPPEPSSEPPSATTELEFAAYGEDCRIFGFLRVSGERLSDLLNEREEYTLQDVLVEVLDDGRSTEARMLVVRRDELLAVRATGPRGNAARRSRMRPSPITLQTGPYTIHGYLHVPPGADPLAAIRRRPPMVPLTEAWIEYAASGQPHRARVGTIIVNHEIVDWVRLSRDDEVRLPDLPAESVIDPQAKDLTGYIHVFDGRIVSASESASVHDRALVVADPVGGNSGGAKLDAAGPALQPSSSAPASEADGSADAGANRGAAVGSPAWYIAQAETIVPGTTPSGGHDQLGGRLDGNAGHDAFWSWAHRVEVRARLSSDWATLARAYRTEAYVARLETPVAADDSIRAMLREWSHAAVAALRTGGAKTLVVQGGADCCPICQRDQARLVPTAHALAFRVLPHESCARGWCPCEWASAD